MSDMDKKLETDIFRELGDIEKSLRNIKDVIRICKCKTSIDLMGCLGCIHNNIVEMDKILENDLEMFPS